MQLSRIGPIALEEPLGGAADSNVLRGIHLERNMKMAVKLLPRHLINRPMGGDTFAADVKLLQKLVHPNIARVYGGAWDDGQPYLAMELVAGESLRSRLDRLGRLPWETTVDLADAICTALDFAHQTTIVHRRLNPARVLLTEDGGVKLIGFDAVLADRDEVLGLRVPMIAAQYMAPEEFRGKTSARLPTSDLFSLGVILYECLTGQLPWKANTPAELVQARRNHPAPRVSATVLECPVWLDVLVARLLERKRADRFPTAEATHRAIVDAKQKVASGMGAVQHAWSGRRGALATDADRQEISALRKKQVVRERDDSPFYERAWFLGMCLAAVVGVGVWSLWPKSEASLYADAKPLMESDDPVQWRRAQEQYLDELLERFPNTQHAQEIEEFEDRFAIHRAQERVKNIDRFGRTPETKAEAAYAEGWRKERFGDLETAWRLYEQAIRETPDDADADGRAYAALARQGVARIKTSVDERRETSLVLRDKIDEAKGLIAAGQTLVARRLLDEAASSYEGRPELKALVTEARELIHKLDATPSAAGTSP